MPRWAGRLVPVLGALLPPPLLPDPFREPEPLDAGVAAPPAKRTEPWQTVKAPQSGSDDCVFKEKLPSDRSLNSMSGGVKLTAQSGWDEPSRRVGQPCRAPRGLSAWSAALALEGAKLRFEAPRIAPLHKQNRVVNGTFGSVCVGRSRWFSLCLVSRKTE